MTIGLSGRDMETYAGHAAISGRQNKNGAEQVCRDDQSLSTFPPPSTVFPGVSEEYCPSWALEKMLHQADQHSPV